VAHRPCRTGGRPTDGGNPGPGKQPAQQQEANAGRASTRWVTIRMSQRGPVASPGRGTSGGGGAVEQRRRPGQRRHPVLAAQASFHAPQPAAPTAAQRSARTSGPSSCCGRGTRTWMEMGMLVRASGSEG
jgi:hypothetical protein